MSRARNLVKEMKTGDESTIRCSKRIANHLFEYFCDQW